MSARRVVAEVGLGSRTIDRPAPCAWGAPAAGVERPADGGPGAAGCPRAAAKLRVLNAGERPEPSLLARLKGVAALPYVEGVLALPDLHQKERMEVPSSLAITTANTIVPEFTSVAINDGMGVVVTDLEAREMSPERIERFFTCINANSAAHPLDANRYSLSAGDLARAAFEGGRAVLGRYGLAPAVLDRMEWGGRLPVPPGRDAWSQVVPAWLRASPLGRSEMGLNFGGNHFLEVQVVDRVLDVETAARWGLARDQVVIMYHLGPGPFSGTLLHHYSRREKLSPARAPLFFLSKLLLHYGQRRRAAGGAGPGSMRRAWSLHFRRNGWTAYSAESEEGVLIRQALAMATNFGFAYRLATVAAIRDALHEALAPAVRAELLCDISHNSIVEEPLAGGTAWVARHNACRLARGGPAIVAGSHDVPSYLALGVPVGPEELHSYDHGAGHLIEARRRAGRLEYAAGSTTRLRMTRGRGGRIGSLSQVPVCSSEPVDRLLACLALNDVMQPVARLRPAGTLKN